MNELFFDHDVDSHRAQRSHWEKFLGTVNRNLVVKIVFNNIFRVEITWSSCNVIWEISSVQSDVVVVLTNVDLLYEPCIFWRYSFFSWFQWPDCMDVSRWIVWIHFWGLFVAIDGKLILHELQCCQKDNCTLQLQRIGQNIAFEYFTIFILPNLSRSGKKNDEHCTAQSLR